MCESLKHVLYSEAKSLLNPGDVLLFRGFSPISFLISGFTDSAYTHVAVVDKFKMHDGEDFCEILQFREFKGGVISSLWREVERFSGRIDVYRPEASVSFYSYNPTLKEIELKTVDFAPSKILEAMREISGLEYGYQRIFSFWFRAAPFLRFFSKKRIFNWTSGELLFPVCSTSVAWTFAQTGYFLTAQDPNWTTPGDLAASPRLSYLFTLVKD